MYLPSGYLLTIRKWLNILSECIRSCGNTWAFHSTRFPLHGVTFTELAPMERGGVIANSEAVPFSRATGDGTERPLGPFTPLAVYVKYCNKEIHVIFQILVAAI